MAERPPIVDPDLTPATVAVKERPPIVNPDVVVEGERPPIVEPQNYLEFAQESGIDEKKAKGYEDATINKMAYGINTDDSMRSKTGLNLAISHSPQAGIRRRDTKTLYQGVSTLGAAFQYPTKPEHVRLPSDRLGPEQVTRYADIYLEQGRITKEEHRNVITSDNPGESLFNIDAVFTTAYPPLPKHFYDKGLGERASEAPGAFAGGVNYALGGFFHGVQWLQGETGVNIGAKGVADWLDDNAAVALKGIRQDFGTDLWGAVGSMSTLVLPAAGVGKVARFAGLTERVALTLEISSATAAEALMEAGGTYNQVLEGGGTQDEANRAARISFGSNVALIGVTNRLGLYRNRFDDMAKKSGGKFGKVRRTGKAAAEGFAGEAAQESGQEVIGQVAKGEPIDLDAAAYAGFLGGLVGGGTSALMSIASDKIDDIGPIPPEVERVYDKTVQAGLDAGLSDEQAHVQASQAIQAVEGGPEYTDKVMQAQEAVTQAEAAMGRDVPTPETQAQLDTFESVTDQLAREEITEDEAISLLDKVLDPLKGEEGAVTIDTRDTVTISDEQFDLGDPVQRERAIDRGLELFRETGEIDMNSAVAQEIIDAKLLIDELGAEGTAETVLEARRKAEIAERGVVQEAKREKALDAILREQEVAQGLTLLSETGQIDLTSPVALDVIKARILNEAYTVRDNFNDILDIGRSVIAEGKAKVEDFTARMKEVLGEAWEKVKPYLKTAWDVLNNEVGAITIGPEGRRLPTVAQELARTLLRQEVAARKAEKEGRPEEAQRIRDEIGDPIERIREAMQRERDTRKGVARFIQATLPPGIRGKFVDALASAKTPGDFSKLSERVDDAIIKFEEAQKLKKNLATQRQKLGFIRKIGEFNQTAINEIKQEVGLTKPLSQATETQLDAITDRLKARLRFKRSRGFNPTIEARGTKKPDIQEVVYKSNRDLSVSQKSEFRRKLTEVKESVGDTVDKLLGTISSRLADINPKLRTALRKFEFKTMTQIQKDQKAVLPFLEKAGKMSKEDHFDFDLAAKNGDTDKINELIDKYDMKAEYDKVRSVLDDIYTRAQGVGFDIGYQQNYFPRQIKDTKGFLEWFSNREDWSIIQEAIQRKEMSLGRVLTFDEKASLINTMIRGYSGGNITLSGTGAMKQRIIDFVSPELNQFYEDSLSALPNYIGQVDEGIGQRVFFGKSRPIDGEAQEFNNLDDSLGFYITDLITQGLISPSQEKELRGILQARFGEHGTSGAVGIYKNLSYVTLLGSPLNAVTQLGDMAFSLYAGGVRNVLTTLPQAIIGKSVISKEDIGIEKIAAEVENKNRIAELVTTVFNIVGLTKIDTVGKETLINSVILKYQKLARNEAEGLESFETFKGQMRDIFEEETDEVIRNLQNDVISENVKYLAFNELLNFQPIALSEVPEVYLKAGNGRIFYALKTWTLKMLDVFRNEVFRVMRTDKVQGVKNMLRLGAWLVTLNATADVIKLIMKGEDLDDEDVQYDILVDNLLTLIGFSRYSAVQARRDGIGSAVTDQISPPTNIVDNIWLDVNDLFKDSDESFDVNNLRSIKNIPVIGQLYYWWFGRAAERRDKKPRRR